MEPSSKKTPKPRSVTTNPPKCGQCGTTRGVGSGWMGGWMCGPCWGQFTRDM